MHIKSIFLIFVIVLVSAILNPTVFSAEVNGMDEIIGDGDNFILAGKDIQTISEGNLESTSKYIYNLFFTIAVVVVVVVGMILGIQFMTSGSEEQAKIKETLIPYTVGVFVIFGAFTIWKIIITIGNKIVGGS